MKICHLLSILDFLFFHELPYQFLRDLISFFESQPTYHVESNGNSVLIKGVDRLASIEEIKKMMAFAEGLGDVLAEK